MEVQGQQRQWVRDHDGVQDFGVPDQDQAGLFTVLPSKPFRTVMSKFDDVES